MAHQTAQGKRLVVTMASSGFLDEPHLANVGLGRSEMFYSLALSLARFFEEPYLVNMGRGTFGIVYGRTNFIIIVKRGTDELNVVYIGEVEIRTQWIEERKTVEFVFNADQLRSFKMKDIGMQFSFGRKDMFNKMPCFTNAGNLLQNCRISLKGVRSEVNIPTWPNQMNTTRNKFFQDNDESYDDNILYTKEEVDWDGKMTSQVHDKSTGCNLNKYGDPFCPNKRKETMQQGSMENQFGSGVNAGQLSWDTRLKIVMEATRGLALLYSSEKKIIYRDFKDSSILLDKIYGDGKDFCMLHKFGTKEDDANDEWDGKMTSQVQDKSTGCNLNKYQEPFSPDKRKKTVQRVSSFVIATTVFLWIILDICTESSIIQLQPFHKQHGPAVFIWSSLLEPFCFMVFGLAIAAMIVVGALFSRMQSAMLMFWAISMLVRSAKSLTEVYFPVLGILFTGWYMLVETQPDT